MPHVLTEDIISVVMCCFHRDSMKSLSWWYSVSLTGNFVNTWFNLDIWFFLNGWKAAAAVVVVGVGVAVVVAEVFLVEAEAVIFRLRLSHFTSLQVRTRHYEAFAQFGGVPCSGGAIQTQSCIQTKGCPLEAGCGNRFRCTSGVLQL